MKQNVDGVKLIGRIARANPILALLVVVTGLIDAAGAFVLWPAYTNLQSRMYTSALGYLRVQRLLGIEMHAEAEHPVHHDFDTPILGEGTIQCNFYNAPVVPTARIGSLFVEEGDCVKKGQVLAALDDTQAQLNYKSAQLAFSSAKAQLQRVEAGSVNTMQAERPQKDQVDLAGMGKIVKEAESKVKMYKKMEKDGASSKLELVNAEIELANAETNFSEAKVNASMSNHGFPQSKEIAQNAVNGAGNLVQKREEELKYYRVVAPADGIIDRVLVRDGEFNQNTGNIGFIIASGMWFEADMDQRAVADVKRGMEATVNLESYSGRTFNAIVERVIPIVTFSAGGPETKTPVRPLGTGTPEWPATFKVRLKINDPGFMITPGMTGFARVTVRHRQVLAVPRAAVSSLSAGKGLVRVVDGSGRPVSTLVSLGEVDDHYVEITGGLSPLDWVLTKNARYLRDDDRIRVTRIVATKD
jgi:multidrug efflux pump subunit AcrA (membrane-fusion protein)